MNQNRPRVYLIFSLVVLALIVIFRPVPQIKEEQALIHRGIVESISESGSKDILFRLGDGKLFYINRGVERGMSIDSLTQAYLGKELEFKYPDYWSLLKTEASAEHASKVSFGDSVIYSEF